MDASDEIREEQKAAEEAGEIGGETGQEDMDPVERASAEHGGGESEGFEQAEELLEERATSDEAEGDPFKDRGEPEANPDPATHGDADEVQSDSDPDPDSEA
jgi:hypothetical protein